MSGVLNYRHAYQELINIKAVTFSEQNYKTISSGIIINDPSPFPEELFLDRRGLDITRRFKDLGIDFFRFCFTLL